MTQIDNHTILPLGDTSQRGIFTQGDAMGCEVRTLIFFRNIFGEISVIEKMSYSYNCHL